MRQSILVVDDEPDFITGFRRVLANDEVEIHAALSGAEAIESLRVQRPDVIFMDLRMPGLDGLTTLKRMREIDPRLIVILMTAHTTTGTVIEAMKSGAYDFIAKPFSGSKLKQVAQEALKVASDMRTVVSFQPAQDDSAGSEMIIGNSEPMQRVYKAIGQVAESNATVLITGESGTGKELVARAIYHHSDRAPKSFIPVNCAAIPENLLESELFGHEKGSFTGAAARRAGKFEVAHDGTIFLDEIGDMSLSTQTKILRVLQDGTFQRVGGNETLKANVRVIAATNRDLPRMIREGDFRADLYYRLNVVHIEMPLLRDRRDDIPALVEYFLRRIQHETKRGTPTFSAQAMTALQGYAWPGNVRELENVVRNLVLTSKTDTILASDLRLIGDLQDVDPVPARAATKSFDSNSESGDIEAATVIDEGLFADVEAELRPLFDKLVEARSRGERFSTFDVLERTMILHALNTVRGNQVQAAKLLGITRSTLRKRILRYGLRIDTTAR